LNVLDTPENRATLEEELRATIQEKFPKEKPEASRAYGMKPGVYR